MGVTIYDIAKAADVSIATVSRVLNNKARVSDHTRGRVLAVAERMGYQPHVSAQNLARQTSQLLSAVVPVMTNYFYMEVMRGMQAELASSVFDLLVYAAPTPQEADSQFQRAAQRGRAEGLVVLSIQLTEARVKRLKASRLPVVVVDAFHPDFDCITVDNFKGGYLATQHLLAQGYERVAHITVFPEPPPALRRREGYERAIEEAGLLVDRSLIAASDRLPYGFVEAAGYDSMQSLLRLNPRPDAVFVASDIQALGAMRALQEAGLRTPDDIGIVGFDDIDISQYVGLTTLQQPMYEMGKLAVEKLLLRIEHPEHPVSHTVFSPRLVERETSRHPQMMPVSRVAR